MTTESGFACSSAARTHGALENTHNPKAKRMSDPLIKPPFRNPVLSVPQPLQLRSTLVVKSSVDARIKQIYPKSGVLQTTINLLLDKLCYELDKCRLTEFDPGAYERAITGCRIELDCGERGSVTEPSTSVGPIVTPQTDNRDDRPGTLELERNPTESPVVVPDVRRPSKGRRPKGNEGEKSA